MVSKKVLNDKVVIVTGASSGIGRACALAFAYMKPQLLEAVAAKILKAVIRHMPRIVILWQAWTLFLSEALSSGLSDLMVRLLSKSWFMLAIGMHKGFRGILPATKSRSF